MGASAYVTVSGCEIGYCGKDGVLIQGEYEKQGSDPARVLNSHQVIANNYIHHVGRRTISACGIVLSGSANDNLIAHNLVTDSPKSGILMFSAWDLPRALAVMNNNVIRNNELARCVTSSWDGGAFYIGATTDNTLFENNRIANVWSWFNATWPQPEDRPDDACSIDFNPGMTFNTRIRNNLATARAPGRWSSCALATKHCWKTTTSNRPNTPAKCSIMAPGRNSPLLILPSSHRRSV